MSCAQLFLQTNNPLKMHEAASGMQWNLPNFMCSITSFTFFSTIYTSSLLLMAVAVVRYVGVAFPITYKLLQKPVYPIVISAVIWLISMGHCSITFIIQHHPSLTSKNSSICYENFTQKQLEVLLPVRLEFFFVVCLIPLIISIFCYVRLILILYSRPRISWMQKRKAIGMALGTLAVFLICVLPYNFSHLLGFFQGKSPEWRYYTLLLVGEILSTSAFSRCMFRINLFFYFQIYIISFLIGLPANLVALYAFSIKIHHSPLPTDILLLNLTVSDLLFLIILPLKMHEAASGMQWNLPNLMCSITSFTFFSTIHTSSLLLMAIAVVRYVGAAFPVIYQHLKKPVYPIIISAVIWLTSMGHCSITFIIQHHPSLSSSDSSMCYENFTEKQLEVLLPLRLEFFFLFCLVPLLITTFCYMRLILILYSRPRISWMQKRKAIGMALGTLAVFLICVGPFNFSFLLGYFQGQSPVWRYYTLLLSTLNTCIDPIIFYFSSSIF
uniref:Si:ch211-231m23.4 n=1 Tax=Poecilia formosa TaxID=48698 RepID=A0A087YQZ2_POEFO